MRARFYEILPGALAWITLIAMVVCSWLIPAEVAIFIILFDIYWLLKTIYLSIHLRFTFGEMKKAMRVNWLSKLKEELPEWENVRHLIIFPMYKEPYEVVRESFASLVKGNYPVGKMTVALATEEAGGAEGRETAERIEAEFKNSFGRFLVTTHPKGMEGEIPGKGGNETWAAKEAKKIMVDEEGISPEKILVSSFDVDTQIYPEYFGRLTHLFLTTPNNTRAIYQPIPLFTNNVYESPAIARVISFSSTFWQMMQQARAERLTTFSSQSIPLSLLLDVGYWHTHVVSEDSRIFWQAYLHYHGDFQVLPMNYPVSMDANVAPTFWGTLKNLYKQQRRWGWGAENIPYMMEGFRTDPKISKAKKRYWIFMVLEGFHSWATNSIMIFALGWLPVLLGGQDFHYSMLSYSLPQVTRFIVQLSMLGIASSAIAGILLLPPKPEWFRSYHYGLYILQWALIPITLIIFGAIPGLEAQTRLMLGGKWRLGFWVTPKSRKGVGERA